VPLFEMDDELTFQS